MKLFDRTQYDYWKGFLSYDLLWALSIVGGALALDHLYLRSPVTFLIKIVVNIFTLGLWWLYDALQLTFNRDVVKIFGLPMPTMGHEGLGSGVLASDIPTDKHASFLFYGLTLIVGGIFGADAFLTGNRKEGFVRLISLITVLFAPVAFIWYGYKLFRFFFKTGAVLDENWEYFGAPRPVEPRKPSILDMIGEKFPFLQRIIGIVETVKDTASDIIQDPLGALTGPIEKEAVAILQPLESSVEPIVNTIKEGETVVENALNVARDGISAIRNIGKDITEIASSAMIIPGAVTSTMNSLNPDQLTKNITVAKTAINQSGGVNSSFLGYILISTIAIISVSEFLLSFRRFRQNRNVTERTNTKNDTPPEPRAIGRIN